MTGALALSPDQQRACTAVLAALAAGEPVVVLTGPAGSGKTTLLRALMAELSREIALLCPTGKAAARLSAVTGRRAHTIHRALYGRVKEEGGQLRFDGRRAPCRPGGLVICDEASMVDAALHADLLCHLPPGAQLLYVGDREQLPPVSGAWGPDLAQPTAALETIHRQAERSPILALATAIRTRQPWSDWVPGVCEQQRGDPVPWLAARLAEDATLITTTNQRRCDLNAALRERQGWTGPLVVGERLVCLVNNPDAGLMNGEVFTAATAVRAPGPSWIHRAPLWEVEAEGLGTVMINTALIGAPVSAFQAWRRGLRGGAVERLVHVDYGYCLTVHKAQGSQWQQVGFVSCPAFRRMRDRRRLAYTAVTRAAERLVIFQPA